MVHIHMRVKIRVIGARIKIRHCLFLADKAVTFVEK